MDFHSLTRRALQSLCKKNKIQANMTNVAMADALKALPSVEGVEEFQEGQHLLSSKKKAPELKASGRKTTAPPEPQGSPLPRSRRVTARAPQEASKLATSEEEEGKEEEKTAGATMRRRTRRQPTTTTTMKAGDVDVGTRRTTRRRAAIKMTGLRAEEEEEEEEEEEAKDVVENVVSNEQSTEEMETKEGEGKQGTNRMVPVEQPKEDQKKEEEEEEEAEFSDGEIQEVEEEHSVVLNDEEAAKFSNGGIRVVEHTTVLNDELGVEAAQMDVEISMIDQNRDSEEEEEEEEEAEAGEEESMVELSVDVPAAATDQTSQVGMVDPSDDGLSPAELVQEDDLGSADSEKLAVEFVNGSVKSAHDPTVESENEQSSNGADHDGAEDDDKFAGEESSEAAEMSKTNEEEPDDSYSAIDIPLEMGDFGDELGGGDSAVNLPVEVEDIVPGHLTGELAGEAAASAAKEGSMEENKQSSNGDNTDHAADGGGDGDNDVFFAADISDENEKADNGKEEGREQYNDIGSESENANDSGGDSAIEVPVQIQDMGDEDVVLPGLLVGEIAVEEEAAAATTWSPVNIDPVPLSDDADNNTNNNNNNKENENADRPEPGRNGVDGLRKAELENLSLRKLRAMYKDTLLVVINKNKGEEKKRSALQALDENCLSLK